MGRFLVLLAAGLAGAAGIGKLVPHVAWMAGAFDISLGAAGFLRRYLGAYLRGRLDGLGHRGQRRERRIVHQSPEAQLFLEERRVVLLRGMLYRVVLWIVRLHQHFAAQFAAPRATRHLREQLEGALRGAEVRQAERHIRADHAHQRDALEVVSLRHHLRAYEDVDLA